MPPISLPRVARWLSHGVLPWLFLSNAAQAADMTLADALMRTAANETVVAVGTARRDVASAGIAQADVRPQDVAGIDVEELAGTGSGANAPGERYQSTAWYERTWERGGKRMARIGAAQSELGVAAQRDRVRLLDLFEKVQAAWIDAQATEAAIPVAEERLATLRRFAADVRRRVSRAVDPLFAAERAKTATAQAEIALEQARANARIARAGLASYWAGIPDFRIDMGGFRATGGEGRAADATSPDLALLASEKDAADARLKLARTADTADPSARVGVRHFGRDNNLAVVVGGSMPLGSRAANRGNVARATAERQAVDAELALARIDRMREADRLAAERLAIVAELGRIDAELVPSAERAIGLIENGFRRGGTAFTFLELTQAQQALIDIRTRRIDLLRRFHLAGARLDRLDGRHAALIDSVENR